MEVSEGTEILGDEFHLWGWMVDVGTECSFLGWMMIFVAESPGVH